MPPPDDASEHREYHCCVCNADDNKAYLEKARIESSTAEYTEFKHTLEAAVNSLEHMGAHRPAAESFLSAAFAAVEKKMTALKIPEFR